MCACERIPPWILLWRPHIHNDMHCHDSDQRTTAPTTKIVAVANTIDGTKLENTIGRVVIELLSKYEFVYVCPLEDVAWVLK